MPFDDLHDILAADPVLSTESVAGDSPFGMSPSYFFNLILRKFRSGMNFSTPYEWESSLFDAILSVVLFCSKEKMCKITASAIIARVANAHAVWNISEVDNPCDTMSQDSMALKPKKPISIFDAAAKVPAFLRSKSVYFFKKSVLVSFEIWRFLHQPSMPVSTPPSKCDSFVLHKSVRLICATLLARQGVGAFSFSHKAA